MAAPYMPGGPIWATRVLAPSWTLLSGAAGALHALLRPRLAVPLLLLWTAWMALPAALIWPTPPTDLPARYWLQAATFSRDPMPRKVVEVREAVLEHVDPRLAILTDDASLPGTDTR